MKVNLIGPSRGIPPEKWVLKIEYETAMEKSLLASFICAQRYDLVDENRGRRIIRRGTPGGERYNDLYITELEAIKFVRIDLIKPEDGDQDEPTTD